MKNTLAQAIDYYLSVKDFSNSTVQNIEQIRAKLAQADLLYAKLSELTPAVIRNFLNELNGLKQSYKHRIFSYIKAIVNTYLSDHELPKVKWDNIIRKPPVREPEEGEEPYITLDELKQLLQINGLTKKQSYARDLFALGCLTGMAAVDLLKFHPMTHLSTDNKWITYYRQKTNKVATRKCVIPVLPLTLEIINRLPWPVRFGKRSLHNYCETLITNLVGRKMTSHSMRKSAGAIMLEVGFTMDTVAQILGHANPATTARIYAKVSKDKMKRELEKIDQGLVAA